jgi:hypothetical protein
MFPGAWDANLHERPPRRHAACGPLEFPAFRPLRPVRPRAIPAPMLKTIVLASGCLATLAHAGPPASVSTVESVTTAGVPAAFPGLDIAKLGATYAGDMDFETGPGSLDVARFQLSTLLSKPISPTPGLTIVPMFDYKATLLNFDGVAAGYPIGDEDLHSLSLSAFALSMRDDTPWVYAAYAKAELASDFQSVGGDDFTFDVAGGIGYRFTDHFMLGVGVAVANLNGDESFYPGINFDWIVNDQIRVGAYGPLFLATYTPHPDWFFSIRGENGGGIWNISDSAGSESIDLTTYNLSVNANRRLTGKLWLSAGVGATFGNEIELTKPDGDRVYREVLDSGLFTQVSLRLMAW